MLDKHTNKMYKHRQYIVWQAQATHPYCCQDIGSAIAKAHPKIPYTRATEFTDDTVI
jgi:hypothetical protein